MPHSARSVSRVAAISTPAFSSTPRREIRDRAGAGRSAGTEPVPLTSAATGSTVTASGRGPSLHHCGRSPGWLRLTTNVVRLFLPFVNAYQQRALQALGDPTRREIFERLTRSPLAVGQLAQELPVSRPAVSQHLKVLKEVGLVFDRPVGTRRVYQVDPNAVAALREYFDAFWGQALKSFQTAAQAPNDDPQRKET